MKGAFGHLFSCLLKMQICRIDPILCHRSDSQVCCSVAVILRRLVMSPSDSERPWGAWTVAVWSMRPDIVVCDTTM